MYTAKQEAVCRTISKLASAWDGFSIVHVKVLKTWFKFNLCILSEKRKTMSMHRQKHTHLWGQTCMPVYTKRYMYLLFVSGLCIHPNTRWDCGSLIRKELCLICELFQVEIKWIKCALDRLAKTTQLLRLTGKWPKVPTDIYLPYVIFATKTRNLVNTLTLQQVLSLTRLNSYLKIF